MNSGSVFLPLIESERVQWVFTPHWYDGPLEGIATLDGERVWVVCVDEDGDDRVRTYQVVRHGEEVWERIDRWRDDFRRHVGEHWDWPRQDGGVRPESEWGKYYDSYSRHYDPTGGAVGETVGYFYG